MFSFTPLLQPTIESQLRVEKNLERPTATSNEGKEIHLEKKVTLVLFFFILFIYLFILVSEGNNEILY